MLFTETMLGIARDGVLHWHPIPTKAITAEAVLQPIDRSPIPAPENVIEGYDLSCLVQQGWVDSIGLIDEETPVAVRYIMRMVNAPSDIDPPEHESVHYFWPNGIAVIEPAAWGPDGKRQSDRVAPDDRYVNLRMRFRKAVVDAAGIALPDAPPGGAIWLIETTSGQLQPSILE